MVGLIYQFILRTHGHTNIRTNMSAEDYTCLQGNCLFLCLRVIWLYCTGSGDDWYQTLNFWAGTLISKVIAATGSCVRCYYSTLTGGHNLLF